MSPQSSQTPQPDVMTLLKEARPAHLDPAPDPRRRQYDLARALGEPAQLSRGSRHRVIRPSRVIYGLGAAAAVAGIAVATLTGPAGSSEGSEPNALSASQILLVAADHVRTDATTGKYWRTTQDIFGLELAGPTEDPYVIRSGDREQNWVARSDSSASWAAHKRLGREPLSDADRAAWKRDGSPTTFAVHGDWTNKDGTTDDVTDISGAPTKWTVDPYNPDSKVFFVGHDLSMREVRALPADPAALRAFLLTDLQRNVEAGGALDVDGQGSVPTQEGWLFSTATELLTLPVTPEVRASAYQIMASLSGVQNLGQVKDVTGRSGNAVAVQGSNANGQFENRIIIDANSGLLLADEIRYLKPSAELSWLKPTDVWQTTVVADIGWTDDKPPARTKYVPSDDRIG